MNDETIAQAKEQATAMMVRANLFALSQIAEAFHPDDVFSSMMNGIVSVNSSTLGSFLLTYAEDLTQSELVENIKIARAALNDDLDKIERELLPKCQKETLQ